MFKIADLFLSVNVVAFSLIKTHFVFGEFWFYLNPLAVWKVKKQ
jgi:hypothetical protein